MDSVGFLSQDHRELLDGIDRLRSAGFNNYVDLPEITVCGDQSAGKSSVLEAVSELSLPTKDNLCTRFATELVLRRDARSKVNVSIRPGQERSEEEKEKISKWSVDVESNDLNVGAIIEQAKEVMGLSDSKVFSTDTLRVEVCGPNQPHLTMIDLPGLFRAGNSEQSVNDAAIVRKMVRSYMGRPRSILLAVVSAKSDFALQEITELARELDPRGERTLGLITKPDKLDPGSESEASYIRLAQNRDVVLRLGWHVLRNRSYEMRAASSFERDKEEEKFFAAGNWCNVDTRHLGVKTLKTRLSIILMDQILRQLPSLLQDVDSGISDCQSRLERLGAARRTPDEQRRYVLQVSKNFSVIMKAAVDGVYSDPFFGSASTSEGYQKRLRAVVQNRLTDFAEDMRLHGQRRIIIDIRGKGESTNARQIHRSDYLDEVKCLMRRSRGCELPGTFNPAIVGELFTAQCQPWKNIAVRTKDDILTSVCCTVQSILRHITVDETADNVLRIISSGVETLKSSLDHKVAHLLSPHYDSHPITYNHYLTDTI